MFIKSTSSWTSQIKEGHRLKLELFQCGEILFEHLLGLSEIDPYDRRPYWPDGPLFASWTIHWEHKHSKQRSRDSPNV